MRVDARGVLPCLLIACLAGTPNRAATLGSKGATITLCAKWEGTPLLLEAFEFVVRAHPSCHQLCIEPDVASGINVAWLVMPSKTEDCQKYVLWHFLACDVLQAEEAPSKQLDFIQSWAAAAGTAGSGCWERILAAAEGVLSASQHRARPSWLPPACWASYMHVMGKACPAHVT